MSEIGIAKENSIYRTRFNDHEELVREKNWKILCSSFFQKYVAEDSVLLDLGAGDGKFIRNIKAKRKIVVDRSPHVLELKGSDIEVIQAPAHKLSEHVSFKVDCVFMSNFLEHMNTKNMVLEVLRECFKILNPGGQVIIRQPNVRYAGASYWDFIDHHIALTEHSLVEALEISGFKISELIPRFLPYTAKSKGGSLVHTLGDWPVKLYLKCPLLWRLFGAQTLVIAKKEPS
jgi:SAM-dependent methyltransferase